MITNTPPKEVRSNNSKFYLIIISVLTLIIVLLLAILIFVFTYSPIKTLKSNSIPTPSPVDTTLPISTIITGRATILSGYNYVVEEDWSSFNIENEIETESHSLSFNLPADYSLEEIAPGHYNISISGEYIGQIAPGIFKHNGYECYKAKPDMGEGPGGSWEIQKRETSTLNGKVLHKITSINSGDDGSSGASYNYCFQINSTYGLTFFTSEENPNPVDWEIFLNNITAGEFEVVE